MKSTSTGKVWLVGAGPGDPTLITVRGQSVLRRADIVLYDALSHPSLLEECRSDAELQSVGKRGGSKSPSQAWITQKLIALAREGRQVVRLKGGDPSLFARGAEEAIALFEAKVPFEIVPGVPSPVGAAAFAGIPLTHRELSSSVTFITGSDRAGKVWSPDAWRRLATATETICVLMGMQRIADITQAIIDGGRSGDTPAAVIQWAARPEQRVITSTLRAIAQDVKQAGLTNPALIVVGEVVTLRPQLRWFDAQPLFGRRLGIARPREQSRSTAAAIRERGAQPVVLEAIRIVDPPDSQALDNAVRRVADYDLCLFTSANAVNRFFSALHRQQLDARRFGSCRVGVVGAKTADALRKHGLFADLVARQFVAESLVTEILSEGSVNKVLMPRALVARELLPTALRDKGIAVDVVPTYQTLKVEGAEAEELKTQLVRGDVDVLLFTSSSTVDSIVAVLGEKAVPVLAGLTLASIGPITTATARAHGLEIAVQAESHTVAGLLDALERHFSHQQ